MEEKLPKLYSILKSGKIKMWSIKVTGKEKNGQAVITTETGQVNGKLTIFETIVTEGKNINKKNETTPFEQALSDAKSKWNKKKDSNYTENVDGIQETPILLPMLALKFEERAKDINFPCYVQPKIDGLRATTQIVKGSLDLYSRLKNKFPHLGHILSELSELNELSNSPFVLDGELYSSSDKQKILNKKGPGSLRTKVEENQALTFQEINGLVRKKTLTKEDQENIKNVIYVVYDIIETNGSDFNERYTKLKDYFAKNNFKYIKLCTTEICKSEDQTLSFHDKYVKQGYEGLILRNFLGKYELNYRSKNLQKFKSFQDEEFEIVNFRQSEKSTEKGAIVWECKTKENKTFEVRPKGTIEERKKLFKNGSKYIGQFLTVKFFDYTDDGIPFHLSTLYGGEADIRSLHI